MILLSTYKTPSARVLKIMCFFLMTTNYEAIPQEKKNFTITYTYGIPPYIIVKDSTELPLFLNRNIPPKQNHYLVPLKEFNFKKNTLSPLILNTFPANRAPKQHVFKLWKGVSTPIFKALYHQVKNNITNSNEIQSKLEENIKKYLQLREELLVRESYDSIAQHALKLLDEGNLYATEKLLEKDIFNNNKKQAYRYYQLGKLYELNFKYDLATFSFETATVLDVNPVYLDTYLDNLKIRGKYADLLKKSKEILYELRTSNSQNPLIEHLLNYYIGITLNKQGRYQESYSYLLTSHQVCQQNFGTERIETATSSIGLGIYFYNIGDFDQAQNSFKNALEIQLKLLDKDSLEIAESYNYIGNCLKNKQQYKEALSYFLKALFIKQTLFGDIHIKLTDTYTHLGETYLQLNQLEEAHQYLNKGLQIKLKVIGENHEYVAVSYLDLAILSLKEHTPEKALNYLENAKTVLLKTVGENHYYMAQVQHQYGLTYLYLKQYQKAEKHLNQAIETFQHTLENKHPYIIPTYLTLANLYKRKNYFEKTIILLENVIPVMRNHYKKDESKMSQVYHELGELYRKDKNYARALIYYELIHNIQSKTLGKTHKKTRKTKKVIKQLKRLSKKST